MKAAYKGDLVPSVVLLQTLDRFCWPVSQDRIAWPNTRVSREEKEPHGTVYGSQVWEPLLPYIVYDLLQRDAGPLRSVLTCLNSLLFTYSC